MGEAFTAKEEIARPADPEKIDRHDRNGGTFRAFLGIGEKRFLVPVEAVVKVSEEWVAKEPDRTKKLEGPAPLDTKVAPPPVAADRRAEDYASPPYGDTGGRTADRLDTGGYGPYGR